MIVDANAAAAPEQADYECMLHCIREGKHGNGWSPYGVRELGVDEAAALASHQTATQA